MPSITVIVPQFGHHELTTIAIESLLKHHASAPEILVIDDGSPVRQRQRLQQRFGRQLVIVPVQRQRGVTAAWNTGARVASGEYLIFLNNDTRTDGPWIDDVVRPLLTSAARVTGPESRSAGEVPYRWRRLCEGWLLSGWCLAMNRNTWKLLGGFDEQFRMYFSDTDLQLRVVKRWGRGLLAFPLSLTHLGHQTTKGWDERSTVWQRDQARFLARWRDSGE